MAEKQNIEDLEVMKSVEPDDLMLGLSKKGKKIGLIPVSFMLQGGYACRRWNMNNSSPVGEAVGDIDYLRNLPSLLGLGGYLVERNHSRSKLDPRNHYKLATGEAAALDGTMGDYMGGWGTTFYYADWVEGNYYYEAASLKPIPGKMNYKIPVASTAAIGVSVIDREMLELVSVINNTARYRGGNNDATKDGAYNTLLGRAATNLTAATFGEYARKKGQGWEAYWYAHAAVLSALFRIIFGTRDVQAPVNPNKDADGLYQGGLGVGVTTWNNNTWKDNFNATGFLPTDVGVELGDGCGEVKHPITLKDGSTTSVTVPVFFGIKNPFGYLWRQQRGIIASKNADGSADVYVAPKLHSTYDMKSLEGLVKAATIPNGNGYIKHLSMNRLSHVPTVIGGTESTYYADRLTINDAASALSVPLLGGYTAYGSASGLESLYVNSGSSSASNYNSPLCEAAENWDTTPFLAE
jgi:hypothetical protein